MIHGTSQKSAIVWVTVFFIESKNNHIVGNGDVIESTHWNGKSFCFFCGSNRNFIFNNTSVTDITKFKKLVMLLFRGEAMLQIGIVSKFSF